MLTINVGEFAGISFNLTADRYGNTYFGFGLNIGKTISPVTATLNGGWIGSMSDDQIPEQGNISEFLTGWSFNLLGGVVGDLGITISPFAGDYIDHTAIEYGAVIPYAIGGSASYGIKLFDGYSMFGDNK
jgi:hypothetical protein